MFNRVVWYLSSVVVSYLMKAGILGMEIMGSQIATCLALRTHKCYGHKLAS
jgi:hypothetical protein